MKYYNFEKYYHDKKFFEMLHGEFTEKFDIELKKLN